jgi:hypothetical protein
MKQKYIEQLLEDLQNATEKGAKQDPRKNKTGFTGQDFPDIIAQVEQYSDGPMYRLSATVGIDTVMLPADDLLSDEQTALLAPKMECLLNAFNFYPDFPQNTGKVIPSRMRYRAMRERWDSEQPVAGSGEIHLEFCSYDEEDCPFPGYCNTCNEFYAPDDAGTDSKTTDVGFIPSIFNYCDRWCERCAFTGRCQSFAMEKEILEISDTCEKSPEEKIKGI